MQTKLTLRMEKEVIERAKSYARRRGSSLSELVTNYFTALDTNTEPADMAERAESLPPLTAELWGMLRADTGQQPVDEDDYRAYLERKHA